MLNIIFILFVLLIIAPYNAIADVNSRIYNYKIAFTTDVEEINTDLQFNFNSYFL